MKTISIAIPVYNEKDNIVPLCDEIVKIFGEQLSEYDYEIVLRDNCSTDGTQDLIICLCKNNPKIKAVFNAKNFGPERSVMPTIFSTSGDATLFMAADFQCPPSLIPEFVRNWEKGEQIVAAIKNKSEEKRAKYLLRSVYYKTIIKMSGGEQIEHFTGYALYDKSFVDFMRELKDAMPSLRGIVAEFGYRIKYIYFTQPKRRSGKSSYNWYLLYDVAMTNFTSYTKVGMRIATISGFIISAISVFASIVYMSLRIILRSTIPMGIYPILLGVFVLGGLQIFFIGLVGEYVLSINTRIMNKPLVVEERRINFDTERNTDEVNII